MLVAYLGNFAPPHSTENHVRQAFINQGHKVVRIQEGDQNELVGLFKNIKAFDMILWTRTGDLAAKWGHAKQNELLARAKGAGVPTVGFHLDRWWGLDREHDVWTEPFFRCEYMITADGGHQEQWAEAGVNHFWLPPAVSLDETVPGEYNGHFASDIAFVGSWMGGYHAEWTHRPQLIAWMLKNYPNQFRLWPQPGEHVRGTDLRDLYASVKILIGDSCLVGNAHHYWSDRIPETLGRGGFLLHPHVDGLGEHFNIGMDGDLVTWPVGAWDMLKTEIDTALRNDDERRDTAARGKQAVLDRHTYDVRVNQILELIK